jgi:NAD(P)-dependent dehydrogenase (short-subunit alcohol dehydrogenase family)
VFPPAAKDRKKAGSESGIGFNWYLDGTPDDIGPMIASLLSEENRWVNAQRIEVSGGMSI